jgi:NADP-dependent 3-hydroxy acid dehydrogenase YdfG
LRRGRGGQDAIVANRERVVVLTGASAGVGRATARALAREGARVGLIARDRERLEATTEEVRALGGTALALALDVADAQALEAAAGQVEDELGPIDVWINDAMASVFAFVHEISAEEFRRVTETTYLGTVNGTLAALRRMRARDSGTIVQVGSALAYRGIPLQAPYCAAKHAIKGFTESLRTELLHDGSHVRVTTVHLPGLNTTQFGWVRTKLPRTPRPVAPVYQPEVAARAIVWASRHPARRELWVGGSTALTIAGAKLAPAFADRYLARTAVEGQQTAARASGQRLASDDLFAPLPGDRGAHGAFEQEASARSAQLWLTRHRRALWTAAAAGLAAGAGVGAAIRR